MLSTVMLITSGALFLTGIVLLVYLASFFELYMGTLAAALCFFLAGISGLIGLITHKNKTQKIMGVVSMALSLGLALLFLVISFYAWVLSAQGNYY